MTDAEKRQYVYNLYSGQKWQKRVNKMSDEQVTAIYLKHINDGQMPTEEESEIDPEKLDIVFDDPEDSKPPVHIPQAKYGPHANEDQFPSY